MGELPGHHRNSCTSFRLTAKGITLLGYPPLMSFTKTNTFFTSDTHFGHGNIIKYSNRPYKDVAEMDEALIANWNAVVPVDGTVFHCGDVGLCNPTELAKILERLNGKIYLIKGNHEKSALKCADRFEKISDVFTARIEDQYIFMSHYAHRVWNRSHHGVWHLYGHSHGSLTDLPDSLSFDVGVDCTDYRPLTFAEVKDRMDKKTWKPVDHHA